MMTRHVILVALLLAPLAVQAQPMSGMAMPAVNCPVPPAPLPPVLTAWPDRTPVTSATLPSAFDTAMLSPGKAADVFLHPTRQVQFVTQPEKPGGSVAHGGMLAINIAEAGTYQISLGTGAWIDLLKDGAAQISIAHAPGPPCSGVRKTVQFALVPGRYVMQLSGNADPAIQVLVSKVP
jgi:hypothetical protein